MNEYNGYLIIPTTSGGKAGKGHNVTASLKVMSLDKKKLFRYFRYWRQFHHTRTIAEQNAKNYIDFNLRKA